MSDHPLYVMRDPEEYAADFKERHTQPRARRTYTLERDSRGVLYVRHTDGGLYRLSPDVVPPTSQWPVPPDVDEFAPADEGKT